MNCENDLYLYVYQYKDHLGNVRLSYTDTNGDGVIRTESEIVQENNYYPFGLEHKGYNDFGGTSGNFSAQKYKYNGKEYNDAFGLNIYEMDLRQYDPAISRWTVMDPVTHHDFSPYSAFDNNPAFWADPSGADAIQYNWGSGKYDVVDHDGKWVRSFDPGMLGNYLPAIAESINLFFSLNPNDDKNSGGGNGDGGKKDKRTKEEREAANQRWLGELLDINKTLLEIRTVMTPLGEIKAIFSTGTTIAKSLPSILKSLFKSKSATKGGRLVKIGTVEGDVMMFASKIGTETVEGITNFAVKNSKLYLNQLHLQGSSAGNVGREALWNIAKDLRKQYNVKEVIIQGGKRTTGKYKGTVPSPITIKVD